MKKRSLFLFFPVVFLLLAGCAGNRNEESISDASENSTVSGSTKEDITETEKKTSTQEAEGAATEKDTSSAESVDTDSNSTTSENRDLHAGDKKEEDSLSPYSTYQIEYARVWAQLGANQDIDGLYVRHIPAGTPLNPDDETSSGYPEDVIQLAGSRLVDGSVTYSGNGDGTINVYNVPLRWDGSYPAGEDFYTDIINNTELVYVDPGDEERIIELIQLLVLHK